MMKSKQLQFYIEVALCTAIAIILEFVSYFSFKMPQGGTVSFSMIPVFLIAYRWGVKGGLLTGFLFGLLQVIATATQIYHPIQGAIDYFIAFTVVGLSGIFAPQIRESLANGLKGKATMYTMAGVFVGSLSRYLCHVIAGAVFFGEYAPAGQPVIIYSLIYNATYMIPTFILSGLLISALLVTSPRLLKVSSTHA
ncbi:MAG: energy-coupled thiamine transporter ThiT [Bacillaceae bacterium]